MAKFRSDIPARKERRSVQHIMPKSAAMDLFDNASVFTENTEYPPPKASHAAHDQGDCKAETEDDVALPTPIAMLVTSDGREQPIYQPIPGLEHMFRAQPTQAPSRPSVTHTAAPYTSGVSQQGPDSPAGSKTVDKAARKSATLKRRRSFAQGRARREPEFSGDEEDDEVVKEKSYSFYIGDMDKLQKFLRQRFNELTMKPLRGIVTSWIRILEPRRLGAYGKYHEMLPSQMPEEATPPWWPKTIIYKEPSHLKKHDLLTLAIEVMFVHRKIDEIKRVDEMKRRGSWVKRLRQVAVYGVETTAPDNFSSSKGSEHSEQMRQRALTAILPSLFEVAQSYEDHIAQYDLYEGSGNVDPGKGKQHTWQPIPRPARQLLYRKRARRTARSAREQSDCDASADETGPDESSATWSQAQTPQHQQAMKVSSPCTPIEHRSNVETPKSAFNQTMHSLQIEGTEEADVKYVETRQVQPPSEMLAYSQSTPYTAGSVDAGFGGAMFQPMEQSVCAYPPARGLPFNPQSAGYVDQYPMYMAGYPMGYGFDTPMTGEVAYGYGEYNMAGPSF